MERVIVTVKRSGEARVRDLELATDMPVGQLAAAVAQALGWSADTGGQPVTYDVEAHPPGRLLRGDETLAQARAWDGTWLVFHSRSAVPADRFIGEPGAAGAGGPSARPGPFPLHGDPAPQLGGSSMAPEPDGGELAVEWIPFPLQNDPPPPLSDAYPGGSSSPPRGNRVGNG